MEKLHTSLLINASREKVWNAMLQDATYREWTKPFSGQGSYYEGKWEEGAEMRFLGNDESGNIGGGMYSVIEKINPFEFVSIKHTGVVTPDGSIDTTSEEAKKWTPAHENYTFTEQEGGTELVVEMDINNLYKSEFEKSWAEALQLLKQIAERQ